MSHKQMTVVISTGVLVSLFFMSIYQMTQEVISQSGQAIVQDVARLGQIMERINAQCGIIGFAHERNYVDFLTVKSFSGTQVGAMELAHPDGWQGPYLEKNPLFQGMMYEIINTGQEYYLVPGVGTRLPDGRIIGTDVLVNPVVGNRWAPTGKSTSQRSPGDWGHDITTLTWNNHVLYTRVTAHNPRVTCCESVEIALDED